VTLVGQGVARCRYDLMTLVAKVPSQSCTGLLATAMLSHVKPSRAALAIVLR
jgi:hypothetical protein